MSAPRTIFDDVLEEFLRRLEGHADLNQNVVGQLRSLVLARDFKVDRLQDAIINGEAQQ